jgi:hypothetical protein
MDAERQRRVERRAYGLWLAEGQPHGRHEEHWLRALREIEAEETPIAPGKRVSRRLSGRTKADPGGRPSQKRKRA